MSDDAFELKDFEHVEAIPGKALLRIAAAPTFDPAASTLIVDNSERIPPQPAPPGPSGVARVAFSMPAELAAGARSYTLELAGGERIDLPAPSHRRTSRVALAGAGLSGPAPELAKPVDAGAADVIAKLSRRLESERARRVTADTAADLSAAARAASATRLTALETELADARADLTLTQSELAGARDTLRNAQGAAELSRTQASHARAEAEAAESTLIQRAAEIELLRQTLADRENEDQHTYLLWEQITAELTAEIEVARQVSADFQQHARNLQLELADSERELASLRALSEAREPAASDGLTDNGDADDPVALAAKLSAGAAALEQARLQALEAESALALRDSELDRLRGQLPST